MSIIAHRTKGVMGMTESHWTLMGLAAAFLLALTWISLSSAPSSRGYRAMRRGFWSLMLLLFSAALGFIGLNGLNWAAVTALGLPGYAALSILAAM